MVILAHASGHAAGQTWLGAAASFLGMWIVMMAAMMLPSLVPMLWRYRRAVGSAAAATAPASCAEARRRRGEARLGVLTALVGLGYFVVWTAIGTAAFPLSVALGRAVPIATGAIVLAAGALQFSAWKAHHLACCRESPGPGRTLRPSAGGAWRHGLRLGMHCASCSAGLTAILLVSGVMNPGAMAAVTAAITLERLAPHGERIARAIGIVLISAGLFEVWSWPPATP
jgi:predicted metal-binding membrane protein